MPRFCKNCGHPIENGRCPVCSGGDEQPCVHQTAGTENVGIAFIGNLKGDFHALLASRDPFHIVPVSGYVALALLFLIRFCVSLFDVGLSYHLSVVLIWINIVGCLAVGVRGIAYLKFPAQKGIQLLIGCTSVLLGLTGALNLLSMLVNQSAPYNYLIPCFLLLMLGVGVAESDNHWRWFYFCGVAALALSLLISLFESLPFFQHLCLCYSALVLSRTLIKSTT